MDGNSGLKSNAHEKYYGFFRAKVIEVDLSLGEPDNGNNRGGIKALTGQQNKDEKNDYGAVKVLIPDIQTDIDPDYDESKSNIIAFPANSPFGGYNEDEDDSHYNSSVYVPRKGSWVWVFFEQGRLDRAFYVGAFNYQQAKLPPENRDGKEPHKVITVIKTGEGRAIIVSDDKENCRVEITGKKRKMKDGPEGDKDSVYKIDDNQTTILLDERDGKEKLLIRSHKGDFINFNIEDQELHVKMKGDIILKTEGELSIDAGKAINMKAGDDLNMQGGKKVSVKAAKSCSVSAGTNLTLSGKMFATLKATGITIIDGVMVLVQAKIAGCMGGGGGAQTKDPEGDRDQGGGGQLLQQKSQQTDQNAQTPAQLKPVQTKSDSPLLQKTKSGVVENAEVSDDGSAIPTMSIEDLGFTDDKTYNGPLYDFGDFSDLVGEKSIGDKFGDLIDDENNGNWNVLF